MSRSRCSSSDTPRASRHSSLVCSMPPSSTRARRRACSSPHVENLPDRNGQLSPRRGVLFELLAAAARQLVVLRAPVVVGGTPAGLDPAFTLETVQGWVERPLLNQDDRIGDLLDALT